MEFLTSNVQVWHLVVVVIVLAAAFLIYDNAPIDDELVCRHELDDYITSKLYKVEMTDLYERIEVLEDEINRPRTVNSAPYYDTIARLEKQVYELRESRWQRKLARWLGAI